MINQNNSSGESERDLSHESSSSESQPIINPIKEFVIAKYERRLKEVDSDSRIESARSIQIIERDSLSGTKFIYELLQNADDACEKQQVKTGAVKIILTNNFLIFIHNGKPFEKKEVEEISTCVDPNRDKISDPNQIGNKGIGFKAVFSVSSYVLIRSKPNSFRFDKNHEKWQPNPNEWPWQLTPIWTEDETLPEEIKPHLRDDNTVQFILKLDKQFLSEVQLGLEALCTNASTMTFLRKIRQITFLDTSQNKSRLVKLTDPKKLEKFVTVYEESIDQQITAEWYVFTAGYKIPESIRQQAKEQENLAKKYKNMGNMFISMAIRVVNNTVDMPQGPRVFCYLPTEINWPFPFAMSAEFLLDTGRSHLKSSKFEKEWNLIILNDLFRIQFLFMSCLAKSTELWKEVVNLIIHPDDIAWGNLADNKKSFVTSFDGAIAHTEFLKNMALEIKPLKDLKFDMYGFVQRFGDEPLKKSCVHPKIANIEQLKKYKLGVFDVKAIVGKLKEEKFLQSLRSPKTNIELILFLYHLYRQLEINRYSTDFKLLDDFCKTHPFILNTKGQFKKVSEIYFHAQECEYFYADFEFISLIPQEIEDNNPVKTWLGQLGVVKISLSNTINNANEHPETLVRFGRLLFEGHLAGNLKQEGQRNDYNSLKTLRLKTSGDVFVEARKCYLPRSLNPTVALEEIVPRYHFISADYWIDATDMAQLKAFFVAMGVTETINKTNVEEIIKTANQHEEILVLVTKALHKAFLNAYALLSGTQEKLKLQATDGQYYLANELYLPDVLEPEYKLEILKLRIPILSTSYLGIQDRDFFIALGVLSTLKAGVLYYKTVAELSRYPLGADYCKTCAIPHDDNTINSYIHFDFINLILTTKIFWQVLAKQWREIKGHLGQQEIRNAWGKAYKSSDSNIYFLVNKAIEYHYPGKIPRNLYTPRIKSSLGDEASILPIAAIASDLEDEQLQFFQFKETLSIEDCLNLLEEIAKKEICKEIKSIIFIYEQILKNLADNPWDRAVDRKPNLKLLNQRDTFVGRSQAFAMIDEDNIVQGSPLLLKRPAKISTENFKKICDYFEVKTFTKQDLEVEATEEQEDSKLVDLLKQKLPILILFDCASKDITASEYIKNNAVTLLKKLSLLKIIKAACIQSHFKDVYSEDVDCFEHANKATIYYHSSETMPVLCQLYETICHYLGLNITPADLGNILTLPLDSLMKRHFFLTSEKLKNLESALVDLEHNSSSKSGESEEDEPSSSHEQFIKSAKEEPLFQGNFEKIAQPAVSFMPANIEAQNLNPSYSGQQNFTFNANDHGKRELDAGVAKNSPSKKIKIALPENNLPTVLNHAVQPKDTLSCEIDNAAIIHSEKGTNTTAVYQNVPSNSANHRNNPIPEAERKRIGRLGEKYIYGQLKSYYSSKYENCSLTETEKGFVLNGDKVVDKEKVSSAIKLEVIWHNKGCPDLEDSGEPQDFTVIKNENTKKIEVKSTSSTSEEICYLSSHEQQVMAEYKNRYRIFRVYNVGKDSIYHKKIKNPAEKIANGEIGIEPHVYKIKIPFQN